MGEKRLIAARNRHEGAIIARAMYDHHMQIVPQQLPATPSKEGDDKAKKDAQAKYEAEYQRLADEQLRTMSSLVQETIKQNTELEKKAKSEQEKYEGKLRLAARVAAQYAYSVRMNHFYDLMLGGVEHSQPVCVHSQPVCVLAQKVADEYMQSACCLAQLPQSLAGLVLDIQSVDRSKANDPFVRWWSCRFEVGPHRDHCAHPLAFIYSYSNAARTVDVRVNSNAILEQVLRTQWLLKSSETPLYDDLLRVVRDYGLDNSNIGGWSGMKFAGTSFHTEWGGFSSSNSKNANTNHFYIPLAEGAKPQ